MKTGEFMNRKKVEEIRVLVGDFRSMIDLLKAPTSITSMHGHKKAKDGSVEWHFHNFAQHGPGGHDDTSGELGYQHCVGPPSNPYFIKHSGKAHVIDKRYARGHGVKSEPTWFKFKKKIKGGWDLATGEVVEVKDVPKRFK